MSMRTLLISVGTSKSVASNSCILSSVNRGDFAGVSHPSAHASEPRFLHAARDSRDKLLNMTSLSKEQLADGMLVRIMFEQC